MEWRDRRLSFGVGVGAVSASFAVFFALGCGPRSCVRSSPARPAAWRILDAVVGAVIRMIAGPSRCTDLPPAPPRATSSEMNDARPLAGFLWMVLTGACFVGVTAVVKHVGSDVPPSQAAFLRYLLGLVFLVPFLGQLRRAPLSRPLLRLFALRGAFHTLGVVLWFYAMTQITIAEVTALNYLSPVYISIGAALFLGERLAIRRIAAIVAALIGVLLILRPGFREVLPGHVAMLGTAVLFSGSYLIAKRTTDFASPTMVVAMLSIFVTIGLAPFAAAVWVAPTPVELAWLFLVATFATAGHFTMTLAFRAAPVSVTQPVTFLQLVWASLLGWVVFDESLDPWVLTGGTLIVAAVSFIAWREAMLGRRPGVSGRAGRPAAPGRPSP